MGGGKNQLGGERGEGAGEERRIASLHPVINLSWALCKVLYVRSFILPI